MAEATTKGSTGWETLFSVYLGNNGQGPANDVKQTINYGDGQTASGGSGFSPVSPGAYFKWNLGYHVYSSPGTYTASVTVSTASPESNYNDNAASITIVISPTLTPTPVPSSTPSGGYWCSISEPSSTLVVVYTNAPAGTSGSLNVGGGNYAFTVSGGYGTNVAVSHYTTSSQAYVTVNTQPPTSCSYFPTTSTASKPVNALRTAPITGLGVVNAPPSGGFGAQPQYQQYCEGGKVNRAKLEEACKQNRGKQFFGVDNVKERCTVLIEGRFESFKKRFSEGTSQCVSSVKSACDRIASTVAQCKQQLFDERIRGALARMVAEGCRYYSHGDELQRVAQLDIGKADLIVATTKGVSRQCEDALVQLGVDVNARQNVGVNTIFYIEADSSLLSEIKALSCAQDVQINYAARALRVASPSGGVDSSELALKAIAGSAPDSVKTVLGTHASEASSANAVVSLLDEAVSVKKSDALYQVQKFFGLEIEAEMRLAADYARESARLKQVNEGLLKVSASLKEGGWAALAASINAAVEGNNQRIAELDARVSSINRGKGGLLSLLDLA